MSSLTIVASFSLAAMLYSILGFRPETHWLIYLTAGMLLAMGAWQIQTLWRTLLLKKHFNKKNTPQELELPGNIVADKLLDQTSFDNMVPLSITEQTTKHLSDKKLRSP
jgi:cytochrome c biogenesis protein CcdA